MGPLKDLLVRLALVVLLTSGASAQTELSIDLTSWETLATRAEETIDQSDSADSDFQQLREEIVAYRREFDSAQSLNAERITTLRGQISALGPAPEEDGATAEDPEISASRTELNARLASLLAPVQQAQTGYLRAEGLIDQIDSILRERQNEQLLEVSPTPLNPLRWRPALEDLRQGALALWRENDALDAQSRWETLRAGAPLVLLLGLVGAVLIFRGRRWSWAACALWARGALVSGVLSFPFCALSCLLQGWWRL